MTHEDAIFDRLARERASRAKDPSKQRAAELLARLFPEQRAFVEDPCTRKALLCPSRAGKSYALAVYLLRSLITIPRASLLYIVYVRGEAKEIAWNLLKALNDEFRLDLRFGEAELTVTNGRGSWLRLAGCESWGDVDKFRGVPRHLVVCDEAATWAPLLFSDLIYKVIEPRLGDFKGTLVVSGTPGEVLAGPFYEITGPRASEIGLDDEGGHRAISRPYADRADARWQDVAFAWSLHGWSKAQNTSEAGRSAWEEALILKKRNGWSDENPIWMREHLGRWVADDEKLVARYDSVRDDWEPGERTADNPFGLPEGHCWRFVLCCDMGFHDPFALQIGAFSDTHPDLFQVYEDEGIRLTVTGVAERIKRAHTLIDDDAFEAQVADLQGLGGMVVETLGVEHGIYLEKLEQRDKRDHVELLNSGLIDRRIRILKGSRLGVEMQTLAWDATGLKTRPNQPNHQFDAFLGVVRHSRHLEARVPEKQPAPGSAEHRNALALDEEEHAAWLERRRARGNDGLNDDQDIPLS